jgi:hypothetical protein
MAAALEEALAPAPAREIGEWVHSIAGDALDWRQELVHRIESETSTSIPPPMLRRDSPPPPAEVTSGVVATEGESARDQAPTVTNERRDSRDASSTTGSHAGARSDTHSGLAEDDHRRHEAPRSRAALAVRMIGGMVFVGAGVLFGMRWVHVSPDPVPATALQAVPVATSPAESESAIVIGVQRNGPGTAGSANAGTAGGTAAGAGASSTTTTGAAGSAATAPLIRGGTTPAAAPRNARSGANAATVHDECDYPFTVDVRGIRHPKPQCFNKK